MVRAVQLGLCLAVFGTGAAWGGACSDTAAEAPLPPPRPADVQEVPLPPERPPELQRQSADANPGGAETPAPLGGIPLPPERRAQEGGDAVEARDADNASTEIPLPPQRPPELQPPVAVPEVPHPPAESAGDNEPLREKVLASGRLEAEAVPAVPGLGGCGIAAPVRLEAVRLADGKTVALTPVAIMRASLAATLADWVRDDLDPVFSKAGDRLAGIGGIGAYQCRSRDWLPGAKLSEHARGNAIDIESLVTAEGQRFDLAAITAGNVGDVPSLPTVMKETACRRFMTVLGPGSDSFHARHLHVDLEARRSGTHLCQWNVPSNLALRTSLATHPHHGF